MIPISYGCVRQRAVAYLSFVGRHEIRTQYKQQVSLVISNNRVAPSTACLVERSCGILKLAFHRALSCCSSKGHCGRIVMIGRTNADKTKANQALEKTKANYHRPAYQKSPFPAYFVYPHG